MEIERKRDKSNENKKNPDLQASAWVLPQL